MTLHYIGRLADEASYKPAGVSDVAFARKADLLHPEGRWRLRNAPDTTVVLAGSDILRDEGRKLFCALADEAEREGRHGVVQCREFPGSLHDFQLLPAFASAASAAAWDFVTERIAEAFAIAHRAGARARARAKARI